jgi:hemerythrin-like metal-binding protein
MSNVSEIDQQHQKLVNMFNSLNEAVKHKESREAIYRMIDDVISYTRLHFETEERLMAQYEYPEMEWHKNKHKQLVQEALRLKGKLDYVGEQMFTEWFNHWPFANVLAHIQYADKQFEDHIIQRGVKE